MVAQAGVFAKQVQITRTMLPWSDREVGQALTSAVENRQHGGCIIAQCCRV